jgi:hypothetical protein
MGKLFFTVLLLCAFLQSRAQVDFSSALWQDIDSSLQKKTALKGLSRRVDELIPVAISQGNYLAAARCIDYQVRLRDQLTEDSLFFYNSRTADSLLRLPSLPADFKTALNLQLARRLTLFTRRGLRFNRKLYERKDLPVNYAALSNPELLQLANRHFETARQLARNLGASPVSDIIWMSSDPLQFLFRPGIYDIIRMIMLFHRKGQRCLTTVRMSLSAVSAALHLQTAVKDSRCVSMLNGSDTTGIRHHPIILLKAWPGNTVLNKPSLDTVKMKYGCQSTSNTWPAGSNHPILPLKHMRSTSYA